MSKTSNIKPETIVESTEANQLRLESKIKYSLKPSLSLRQKNLIIGFLLVILMIFGAISSVIANKISGLSSPTTPRPPETPSPTQLPTKQKPFPTATPILQPEVVPLPSSIPTPTPAPQTDLKLNYTYLHPQNNGLDQIGTGPISLTERGDDFTYQVFTNITNNSDTTATNIKVVITNNDQEITAYQLDSLAPQESHSFSHNFYFPIGTHNITSTITSDTPDSDLNNDSNQAIYIIEPEKEAPRIKLSLRSDNDNEQTCIDHWVFDNMSTEYEMAFEAKLDSENFQTITYRPDPSQEARYERCISGPAGESHTYTLKVTDKRGNTAKETIDFRLISFGEEVVQ